LLKIAEEEALLKARRIVTIHLENMENLAK